MNRDEFMYFFNQEKDKNHALTVVVCLNCGHHVHRHQASGVNPNMWYDAYIVNPIPPMEERMIHGYGFNENCEKCGKDLNLNRGAEFIPSMAI